MNIKEFRDKVEEAYQLLLNTNVDVDTIEMDFHCDDRSEGTVVFGSQVDEMSFDFFNPNKLKVIIS